MLVQLADATARFKQLDTGSDKEASSEEDIGRRHRKVWTYRRKNIRSS